MNSEHGTVGNALADGRRAPATRVPADYKHTKVGENS